MGLAEAGGFELPIEEEITICAEGSDWKRLQDWWKERRSFIYHLGSSGPFSIEDLIELKQVKNKQAGHRLVKKLIQEGVLEYCGSASFDGDKSPRHLFVATGVTVKANQVKHEWITSIVDYLAYGGYQGLRGIHTDQVLRPDLTKIFPGGKVHFEIDTGSMTYDEVVRKRYEKYEQCEDAVVWVSVGLWSAGDKRRMEGLRIRAEKIQHCAWFTTLEMVRKDPWGQILMNYEGVTGSLTHLLTPPDDEATTPSTTET